MEKFALGRLIENLSDDKHVLFVLFSCKIGPAILSESPMEAIRMQRESFFFCM